MKLIDKAVLLISSGCLIISCSTSGDKNGENSDSQKSITAEASQETMKEFNKGLEHLDNSEYESAAATFKRIITEHPTSEFQLISLYNLGAAYEGMNDCKSAGKTYRQVARSSLGKYRRLEAQALFRLSFAYSCVGEDAKTVVSLLDAKRRKDVLTDEVAMAEIPARLAAAYARMGNNDKASVYFDEAKKGLLYLRTKYSQRRAINDIMAKTLFFMGRMTPLYERLNNDAMAYLESLQLLQAYLIEAVELNSKDWSPKAAEQLLEAYENVWQMIDGIELKSKSDPLYAKQKTKEFRASVVSEALINLKLLRDSRFPGTKSSPAMSGLLNSLELKERRFQNYLAINGIKNPLTDEAEQREGLRRDGRAKGFSPLEKEAIQRSRLPEKEEASE